MIGVFVWVWAVVFVGGVGGVDMQGWIGWECGIEEGMRVWRDVGCEVGMQLWVGMRVWGCRCVLRIQGCGVGEYL